MFAFFHTFFLKNPNFFQTSVIFRLKQAPFSAVRVVSTLPLKPFLVIDILVESFTAGEIPVSISADPDCLPRKNARTKRWEKK